MSAREFNRDVSAAKRKAVEGAGRGRRPRRAGVRAALLDDYRRLGEQGTDLVDRLSMDEDRGRLRAPDGGAEGS